MKRARLEMYYKSQWGFLKAMAFRYLLDDHLAERAVDQCFRLFIEHYAVMGRPLGSIAEQDVAIRLAITRLALPVILGLIGLEKPCQERLTRACPVLASAYHELLRALLPLERVVFNLVTVDRFTHGQAAKLLGISRKACKAYHCAAKRKIIQQDTEKRHHHAMPVKAFALATLLAFSTVTAFAQTGRPSLFKVGAGISFFTDHRGYQSVPRIGLSVGVAPTIPLSYRAYIKPEVSFSTKGGRIDYKAAEVFSGKASYRIDYFDSPLVLGVRLHRRLAVEIGGYAAVKVNGRFDFQGTFAFGYGTFDRKDLSSYDYGPVMGIILHSRRVLVGVRYYYGLNAVAANDRSRVLLGNAANGTIQLYLQMKRFRRWVK